jgi:hypothetical protein
MQGLSKGVLEHMVGMLIAAPRILKHHTLAALLDDPVNATVTNNSRGSISGSCYVSSDGQARGSVNKGPAVVTGKALKAAADAAAQAQAAVTLGEWLTEGEAQEGRREGGQLLLMVVGDRNLQIHRRALDQHVSGRAVMHVTA